MERAHENEKVKDYEKHTLREKNFFLTIHNKIQYKWNVSLTHLPHK